jgi:hypothetical protein
LLVITALLARRKGYNPWCWALAAGLIGLIVLAFLPFANDPQRPDDERARLTKRGNTIGLVFTAIAIVFTAIQLSSGG